MILRQFIPVRQDKSAVLLRELFAALMGTLSPLSMRKAFFSTLVTWAKFTRKLLWQR